MSSYFLDSSALVKRYIPEVGTVQIREITRVSAENRIFISQITSVEFVSALSRRLREKTITSRTMRAARLSFQRHLERQFVPISYSESISRLAMDLLENHPLRAFDAIQLAPALEIEERLKQAGRPSLVFVCADKRLLIVASTVGLTVEEPK